MVHKLDEEIERIHVHLYTRDIDRIRALFCPRLKFNTAVRNMVRTMLDRIEAEAKGGARAAPPMELDL